MCLTTFILLNKKLYFEYYVCSEVVMFAAIFKVAAVLPISDNIQLMTPTNYFDYLACNNVTDTATDKGPLCLIYTALFESETERKGMISCNILFLSTEILRE